MTDEIIIQTQKHSQQMIEAGLSADSVFEFVAYNNLNVLSTFMLVAEMVLEKKDMAGIERSLADFALQVKKLPALEKGLKGGKPIQQALSLIYAELGYLSDEGEEDLSEAIIVAMNYIKFHNPQLRRLVIAINQDAVDSDFNFEYEIHLWSK